jgi:uncharacterized membrane protein YqiK
MDPMVVIGSVGATVVMLMGMLVAVAKCYRRVEQGKALVITVPQGEPIVTFTGAVVVPVLHKAEVMDISLKALEIQRRGKEGLLARDGTRVDVRATFFVMVNKTTEDIRKVARTVGCARAGDPEALKTLFEGRFIEAMELVCGHFDARDLLSHREEFKEQVIRVIGRDLNGYVLDNCVIHELASAPAVNYAQS